MKAELYQNGPMECSIHATDAFEAYTGGIYTEVIPAGSDLNHSIAVVGWGMEPNSKIQYWIGRNSWGSYWGEGGFFRMMMDGNGLMIESECTAGIPTLTKPVSSTQEAEII